MLENDEWKNDIMPEIMDGKNIADFIDPDILEKLDALEREEEKLQAEGFYDSESDMVSLLAPLITFVSLTGTFRSLTRTTSAKPSRRSLRVRRSSSRRARSRR